MLTMGVVALGVADVERAADAAEQAAEVDRLVTLGAERVPRDTCPDDPDFVVLADTEGNRFCIVDLSHEV